VHVGGNDYELVKQVSEYVDRNRHPDSLLAYATEQLSSIPGLRIIGTAPHKGPILTFHIDGVHPLDLATLLDLHNISIRSGHLCAQPLLRKLGLTAAARISFGLYNTRDEVDRFLEALHTTLHAVARV
jgi:cysteine desulfurase/selenocysteine lyase